MKTVPLWEAFSEPDITDEVIKELSELSETGVPYQHFSWDNEDNESFPHIAEYVSNKYNKYRFFIDLTIKQKSIRKHNE